jgi:hypothetical protein
LILLPFAISAPAAKASPGPNNPGATANALPAASQKPAPETKISLTPNREKPLQSQPGEGPAITIDATVVQLGTVIEGDEATCVFNVSNVGKKDLNILKAQPG